MFIKTRYLTIVAFIMSFLTFSFVYSNDNPGLKSFRIALIIGDQWNDPMSYIISKPELKNNYDVSSPNDFYYLTILLTAWGIPFDIIRLDQQYLDRNMFLGPDNKPKYGVILWDVNNSGDLWNPDYQIIADMVKNYGISIIALSNRIQQPEIQSLLGIQYKGMWPNGRHLEIVQDHFITRDLTNPLDKLDETIPPWICLKCVRIKLTEKVKTLVKQGKYPQVTVRSFPSGAQAIWIGSDYNNMFYYHQIRTLIRKSIVWAVGFNLYKTWEKQIIMRMDDPGGAQCAWLVWWHYPTLSEDMIKKYLIKPLQMHDAVLNIFIVPGFVNDEKRAVEPSWRQNFIDKYGTKQDFVSTKKGLDAGLKAGVFEIQCHGLTHMQPDLSSPPTWWGSKLDQEKNEVGWYREFGDLRREKEIPAAEQVWRMRTASQWIKYQFGVTPLVFIPGGFGISYSYENNTRHLAGMNGFGWFGCGNRSCYLGPDFMTSGWEFFGTHESPLFVNILPDGHDFGVTREPETFAKIFELYPDHKFIGLNEFVGYVHASNSGQFVPDDETIRLSVCYDSHYCQHFKNHDSYWLFEVADWVKETMGQKLRINIEKEESFVLEITDQPIRLDIPEGTGEHNINITVSD